MAREHSPRPGAHWQTVPVRREVIVTDPEGPWGGPTAIRPWTDEPTPPPWQPTPPANRADRRAAKRALRKGQR